MNHFLVRMVFAHNSGLAQDQVVNDWHFSHATTPDLPSLTAGMFDFYNSTPSTFDFPLSDYIAATIVRDTAGHYSHRADVYQLPATPGPMGSPIFTFNSQLGPVHADVTSLPGEVSLVASFRADYGTAAEHFEGTRPRARRRGRVYIGPLNTFTCDATAGSTAVQRPAAGFIDLLLAQLTALGNTTITTGGATWEVFSHTDWDGHPVTQGWVDNAYDTQRRRGEKATARDTFTL